MNAFQRTILILWLLISIGCHEDPSMAIPKLTKELESKDVTKRNQAALELAGYGAVAAPAVPSLIRRLHDDNAGVRSSAAYALRLIGTPEAEKALDTYVK